MKEKHTLASFQWVNTLKVRGLAGAFTVVLDVIEPFAPIAAQMMHVVHPVSGAVGMRQVVGDLAQLLDTPDGIDQLRDQLNEQPEHGTD